MRRNAGLRTAGLAAEAQGKDVLNSEQPQRSADSSPYSLQHWPAGQIGKLFPHSLTADAAGALGLEEGAAIASPEV